MKVLIDGVEYMPIMEVPHGDEFAKALAYRFECDDLDGTVTIREYLKTLLERVWELGESFSGKRPFGNSGWEYDLYTPLVAGDFIAGTLDDEGSIADFDQDAANEFVFQLIAYAFNGQKD